MSATELEDVLSLVQRVLPDPSGFAERLFQQAVVWWADSSTARTSAAGGGGAGLDDDRTINVAPADDDPGGALADTNDLLAAALGACTCWGTTPGCATCDGSGSPGWTDPDAELFHLFVAPSVERLSTTFDEEAGRPPTSSGRRERRPDDTGDTDDDMG